MSTSTSDAAAGVLEKVNSLVSAAMAKVAVGRWEVVACGGPECPWGYVTAHHLPWGDCETG